MLEQESGLEDVLRMTPENILDRRLQTQVYLQGLSSTAKQARQLIVHGHISVDGAVTRVPGMIVTKLQEKNITYSPSSALNSDLHPVRPGGEKIFDDESTDEEEKEDNQGKEDIVIEEKKNEESDIKKDDDKGDKK